MTLTPQAHSRGDHAAFTQTAQRHNAHLRDDGLLGVELGNVVGARGLDDALVEGAERALAEVLVLGVLGHVRHERVVRLHGGVTRELAVSAALGRLGGVHRLAELLQRVELDLAAGVGPLVPRLVEGRLVVQLLEAVVQERLDLLVVPQGLLAGVLETEGVLADALEDLGVLLHVPLLVDLGELVRRAVVRNGVHIARQGDTHEDNRENTDRKDRAAH